MTYSGELVMPTRYVEVKEGEMTYLDGGLALKVNASMKNKSYCLSLGKKYSGFSGLTQLRIAKEIYAHAKLYYLSASKVSYYATSMMGLGTTAVIHTTLTWIRSHSNPINIGGDSSFRLSVYNFIWQHC